ncbi:MAG: IS200/IS605 family transposase [Paraclostridium sp.]|uniref:IS200/IS605 family transposase n=1 Tax=Paraclostridium sp. TaxID=2023273 RepID=UPI003A9B291E
MRKEYRIDKKRISYLKYNYVFCPRYRRKIFENEEVKKRFYEIIKSEAELLNIKILNIHCGDDYCKVQVNPLSDISPHDIIVKFKISSSKILRSEFNHLSHLESLWTRASFVTTEDEISEDILMEYLELQKKRG